MDDKKRTPRDRSANRDRRPSWDDRDERLSSKPLPAPPRQFKAEHAGPIRPEEASPRSSGGSQQPGERKSAGPRPVSGSAPSLVNEAKRRRGGGPSSRSTHSRSFHPGESVAAIAVRHALRVQSRQRMTADPAADKKSQKDTGDEAEGDGNAEGKQAKRAEGKGSAGAKRRGKKPGLSITIANSNARTPRSDSDEDNEDDYLDAAGELTPGVLASTINVGKDTGSPRSRRAAQAAAARANSEAYRMTNSGTINIEGFEIRETGITRAPAALDASNGGSATVDRQQEDLKNNVRRICQLGQGASGTVYKAVHVPTLRIVAQKVIPVFETEKRQQMIRELRALYNNIMPLQRTDPVGAASGGCPHIVGFYDAYINVDESSVNIIVEFMNGGSLQDLVDTGGCASEPVLANIAHRVLSGLAFIHERRQIHRDIKPSNLLINHTGAVKISDFGTVRDLENSLALANTFVGTLSYMAPERISGEPYSYASDIWSAGLSIMTCALGEFPLSTSGGYWGLLHHLREDPSPELPEDEFSEEFRDFVSLCLLKDPSARPSARELLGHPFLQDVITDETEPDELHEDGSQTARSELDDIAEQIFAFYAETWALPKFSPKQLTGLAGQLGLSVPDVRRGLEGHLRAYLAARRDHLGQARANSRPSSKDD